MKIIILDFSNKSVYTFPFDEDVFESGEDFISSINEFRVDIDIRVKDCQWMIVDELNIQIY